jgi:hypothetical protein
VRWSAILLVVAVCGCGIARAQDFQIGGDEQRQTEVPIEYRPSLGVFVVGYINGHGPYRFGISVEYHTLLTQRVVKDAGLATQERGVTFYGGGTKLEQRLQVRDAMLQLGDRQVSLDQVEVYPEDDLSAYEPVADFGGWLGIELFRRGIVQVDLSHRRLVFLASKDTPNADDAIELPLEQTAIGSDLDRLPAITMSLNGKPGKFRFGFSSSSVNFSDVSTLGRDLIDQGHDVQTIVSWTPTGTFKSQSVNAVAQVELAGHASGTAGISRRTDAPPMPPRFSPRVRVTIRMPAVDGNVGLGVLGRFDMTIDNTAGKAWLVPRDKQSFTCHRPAKAQSHATLGFRPWLYKDEGIVASIVEGSVAERAGLHAGDRIVSLDDATVPVYYEHLDAACGAVEPVKVVYRNSSGEHTVELTPEAH